MNARDDTPVPTGRSSRAVPNADSSRPSAARCSSSAPGRATRS